MEKGTNKKKLGGYPAVGVLLSVTLALFVIGLFGLLLIYAGEFSKQVRENIKLEVYLKSNLTQTQRKQIEKKLQSNAFVNRDAEQGVTFVSKEDAAKKMIADTGEDFTEFIGENPLHDAFLVSVDPSYHTKEKMDEIKADAQKMNGVFQVAYVEALVADVNKNIKNIALVLAALAAVLTITVVLLINNTLRLALFSQRFLVRSMQLVGATKWFIQWPFLYRAAIYGLIGGAIASAFIWGGVNYAQRWVPDLTALHDKQQFYMLVGFLLLTGLVITVLATYVAMRRYLRMSLDQLY